MNEYVIITDNACDIGPARLKEYGLDPACLTFSLSGKEYATLPNEDMNWEQFFDRLKNGEVSSTSAATVATWRTAAEPCLRDGKDVLILAFSSGLSATYEASEMAAGELRAEYPDRKILVIDSLCASLGFGLFVHYAVKAKEQGKDLEEAYDYLLELRPHLCHWFTVDDLMYLKRGGRVSAATALVGTLLGIKPVLHVDDEGHLISMSKARGRQASLTALVDNMAETVVNPEGQTVFICHGNCYDDAKYVADLVTERFGITDIYIDYVGAVIASHTGPGVVALFFLGDHR